ncbi:Sialyltransferase PMO188 [Actinobacillus equuli]|nr:Sialyltransferase PMO188 [Actinobacillus equuli]
MENTTQVQAIDIYIDFATVPSLSYFLHFLKHKHDHQRLRLFSLARFEIPETIIERYEEGIIQFLVM